MATALVTGPTAGIGRGFAEELARRGLDLVLVARDRSRLQVLADDLTAAYGVDCRVVVADLSVRGDVDAVAGLLRDGDRPVNVLVNNAGFGMGASFEESDLESEQRALDVMVTAVMRLTHAAIPGMVARRRGIIVNVSSVAGWLPGGTYSAAKSWVTVFSESLAQDLRESGVRVVAVCPGFTRTEFHVRAGIDMAALPDWAWLDVPQVVDRAMRDLALGRPVSVAGARYRLLARVLRHGPRSVVRLAVASRGAVRR